MPFLLNAFGTHFWGRTEAYEDGSYITTEWITLLVPIIPIKSFRLKPSGKSSSSDQEYEVLQKFASVYSKQVRHVYKGVVIFFIFFAVALGVLIEIGINQGKDIAIYSFFGEFFVSYLIFIFWVDRLTH